MRKGLRLQGSVGGIAVSLVHKAQIILSSLISQKFLHASHILQLKETNANKRDNLNLSKLANAIIFLLVNVPCQLNQGNGKFL